jgi:hypothetical protein
MEEEIADEKRIGAERRIGEERNVEEKSTEVTSAEMKKADLLLPLHRYFQSVHLTELVRSEILLSFQTCFHLWKRRNRRWCHFHLLPLLLSGTSIPNRNYPITIFTFLSRERLTMPLSKLFSNMQRAITTSGSTLP